MIHEILLPVESSCESTNYYQVLIVTNEYTPGSKLHVLSGTRQDGEDMKEAFIQHNIETHWETNVSKERFLALLDEAIQNLKSNPSCDNLKFIAFVFSGHGAKGDLLVMQDGETVELIEHVVNRFTSESCIAHIPKLFFVDACRGGEKLKNVLSIKSSGSTGLDASIEFASSKGNFLLAYSTVADRVSYISGQDGSRWMSRIATEIFRSGSVDSIQGILSHVNSNLCWYQQDSSVRGKDDKFQQPEIIDTLHFAELIIHQGNHCDRLYDCVFEKEYSTLLRFIHGCALQ